VTDYENSFLFLLKTHINNEKLPDGYRFDVGRVFSLAEIHNVLPMICVVTEEASEDVLMYKTKAKNSRMTMAWACGSPLAVMRRLARKCPP